jgi:acetyl-CoA carboxylase carboxyl transferase subunit beta
LEFYLFYRFFKPALTAKHSLNDAIVTGEMNVEGIHVAIGVMDSRFMMASMGRVVGEKVTRLFEKATKKKLPVILFCCSGGARMQEGIIALMQMEKTAAAVRRHSDTGCLYISVLTNPTMGGVTASFAMLADIILAERGAVIGFAGARVIEQNTGQKLPEGFQTSEFQKKHGFVDAVVERETLKEDLLHILKLHTVTKKEIKKLPRTKIKFTYIGEKTEQRTAWEKVLLARSRERPTSMEYISWLFEGFYELCGDRVSGDDHAIVGGLAIFKGCPVTVIGHQKGKNSLEDAIYRNWGMPTPQGYRKVLRLVKQAEKFGRPVIFFVDTIGAACGKEAEEGGQGVAIANLLQELSVLKTPILSIVIGEGGSGGALALGIGNEVWMLENAVYSILTPEGYASILWKDNCKAPEAALRMKLEASDLYKMGIIDRIINEKEPISKRDMKKICTILEKHISNFLIEYSKKSASDIVDERYWKFRKY